MKRHKDATYAIQKATENYAEDRVTRVYELFHGGRNLVATFPRHYTHVARKLIALLEEEK